MPPVILLSSSPPRVFARSPTRIDSSPSESHDVNTGSASTSSYASKRSLFRSLSHSRDSFSPTFSTARQVLGVKTGAENTPSSSPGRNKFKLGASSNNIKDITSLESEEVQGNQNGKSNLAENVAKQPSALHGFEDLEIPTGDMTIQILPSDLRRKKKPVPVVKKTQQTKAIPRRKDWTPPSKKDSVLEDNANSEERNGFGEGFLGNFAYIPLISAEKATIQAKKTTTDLSMKKRTMKDIPNSKNRPSANQVSVPALPPQSSEKVKKKRSKSPMKKPLTITELATSNYAGNEAEGDTPMMQYLVSTQAQLGGVDFDESSLQTKVLKTKTKKSTGKAKLRSKLVSPKSALKTFEDQDVIFASASQLARDDSPSLLRDTVEAMKQSEGNLMSDPVPTQQTAPISIESTTPVKGTSKLQSRRSLWTAAGRDEQDALLHEDFIFDFNESPQPAFGLDSLVNSDFPGKKPPQNPVAHCRLTSFAAGDKLRTLDINEIALGHSEAKNSVPFTQRRHMHKSADFNDQKGSNSVSKEPQVQGKSIQEAETNQPEKDSLPKLPAKPNYVGFTDNELRKQLNAYGFKRMRNRERMIATLDKCWAEKHDAARSAAEMTQIDVMRHGDFLSKVHDIALRPQPKVKQPRAKKSKPVGDGTVPKASRKRKSDQSEGDEKKDSVEKPKKPRKRKEKLSSETSVVEISDLDNSTYFEEATKQAAGSHDVASVIKRSAATEPTITAPDHPISTAVSKRPLTPPSTVPVVNMLSSSPGFEDIQIPHLTLPKKDVLPTPDDSFASAAEPPEIKDQILKALKIQTRSGEIRNHQTNPTWHEKILMYDPIVLEDFTAWLNTSGLNAAGEDREIDIMDVRAWCEENGICCLWKGGWRGRGLKGKTDGAFD